MYDTQIGLASYGIATLGSIDDDRSLQILREILEHPANEEVRRAAVESSGRLQDREALPFLVRLLQEESLTFWMRSALVQAFIAIDPLETVDDELRLIEEIAVGRPSGERSALYLRGAVFQHLKPQLDALEPLDLDDGPIRNQLLSAVFKISGWTSLMQSAQHDQVDASRQLIESGADVNAKNVFGETALTLAAKAGVHEIVEMLLGSGAHFQRQGTTALMETSRNGHLEIVETLLRTGASVHTKSSGIEWTALMHAADQGHADIIRLLLEKGAKVNVASANGGLTPLILASWKGHPETTELLLKAGARVSDKTDRSYWEQDALLFAPWGGNQAEFARSGRHRLPISGPSHRRGIRVRGFDPSPLRQ